MSYKNLGEFLRALREAGELAEVAAPVDPVLEVTEIYDRVVKKEGRSFDGMHGDGTLSTNGSATVSTWPGYSTGEVTGATTGSGFRGGTWIYATSVARVSDRYHASRDYATRYYGSGARAARTSP